MYAKYFIKSTTHIKDSVTVATFDVKQISTELLKRLGLRCCQL